MSRPRARRSSAALLGAALVLVGTVGASLPLASGAGPQPQAIEPLLTLPFSSRTMVGLETNLVSPLPAYDHFHDIAFAPDGHMAIAVGSHNVLVGWTASPRWAAPLRNGTYGNLYGVAWSDDSTTALAVGYNGLLVHYTNTSIVDLPPQDNVTWRGVTWFSGKGFLVVGDGGRMFFLNGTTRTNVTSPTTSDLLGVSYSALLDKALAVGRAGAVAEILPDGSASLVPSTSSEDLRSVAFESDTGSGYIAGGAGVLLTYIAGTLASATTNATNGTYYDVAVVSSSRPAVVALHNNSTGAFLFHNTSNSSTLVLGPGLTGVEAVARSPTEGYVLAVGLFGAWILWENDSWITIADPFRPTLFDAAWSPEGNHALLVGLNGTILRYNRTANTTSWVAAPNYNTSLRGVSWASDGSGALIVGANAFWRYALANNTVSEPLGPVTLDLYAVAWRPNTTQALVAGTGGYLAKWDGASLTRMTAPSFANSLFAIAWHADSTGTGDYAFAAGANVALRYDADGTVSSVTRLGTFFSVAFKGENVWMVGDPYQIQFYNASTGIWDNLSLPSQFNTTRFYGVAAVPGGERMLVVGDQSFAAFVYENRIVRVDLGFLAAYRTVRYNPVTDEPLLAGALRLAFTLKQGVFANLAPNACIRAPLPGSNFTTADTITFDATCSGDADGDALTFSWWDNTTGYITSTPSFGARLDPGNHTLTVYVDDGQGNNVSSSVSVSVSVAQYSPVAVMSQPDPNGTYTDDTNITFSAIGSYDLNANDTLSYEWRSSLIGVFGNASIVVSQLPAGTHTITLTVADSTARTGSTSILLVVQVGNQPPSLTVTSPKAGTLYAPNIPILFDASATTDPDSPSITVTWYLDGVVIGVGAVFERLVPQGTHTIDVVASDGQKSTTFSFPVDVGPPVNLPPKFLAIFPANNTPLKGLAVFNGTMEADPAGPVLFVELKFGPSDWMRANGTTGWSIAVDTTLFANGPVDVQFRATDGALETTERRVYLVDNPFINRPPTLTITTPAAGATVQDVFTLLGTVADDAAGILEVQYRLPGGGWAGATVVGSNWSSSIDSRPLRNGPVIIEVRAFDGANYSEVSTLTVIVDNPAAGGGFLPGPSGALVTVALLGAAASVLLRAGRNPRD